MRWRGSEHRQPAAGEQQIQKKRLKNRVFKKGFKPPQLQASKGCHRDEHDQGARAKKHDECEEKISDFVNEIAEFLG